MSTLSGTQVLEQLNWRYAVKKFDSSKKISSENWSNLEQALVLTPSSYGLQPWKFLVVQSSEVRKQLTPLSWNQTQIADCSHLVVLTHLKTMTTEHIQKYLQSTAQARGISVEAFKGYGEMMEGDLIKGPRGAIAGVWASRQTYIAMGNLMTTAAMMGIDTCPMEGIDPAGYDKVLNLTGTEFQTVAVVACGYRHSEDALAKQKKSRFAIQEIIKTI